MQNSNLKRILSVVNSNSYFQRREFLNNKNEFNSAINFAERNGLYFLFVDKIMDFGLKLPFLNKEKWQTEVERQEKLINTIHFLNRIKRQGNADYVLIKSFNTLPNVPKDIDIFVKKDERQKLLDILEKEGMIYVQSSIAETKLKGKYLNIDIYTEINYLGVDFIDVDFIYRSITENEIFGLKYCGLNYEADFLLTIIHGLFGHRRFTLLDFLHINNLMHYINLDFCRDYAEKKGWGKVFDLIISEIESINKKLYYEKIDNNIDFPYLFSETFILDSVSKLEQNDVKINTFFLLINLIFDRITFELVNSPLYTIFESNEFIKASINSFSSFLKRKRGDKKSV